MKFSNLLLSLLFITIFHFQPIQTLESLTGTWSTPSTLSETSDICCIPISLTTKTTTDNTIIATYKYKENNDKCIKLFGESETNRASLILSVKKDDKDVYVAEQDTTTFNFKIDENSKLSIELVEYSNPDECKFSLDKDTVINPWITLGILTVISLLLAGALLFLRPKTEEEEDLEGNFYSAPIANSKNANNFI